MGDELEITGLSAAAVKSTATGVEMFKKSMDQGQAGDNVGILLRGLKREDVMRGQVLCKPGSVTTHKKFEAEVYVLTKEEGGRHTPFMANYKPQFFLRTAGTCCCFCCMCGGQLVLGLHPGYLVLLPAVRVVDTLCRGLRPGYFCPCAPLCFALYAVLPCLYVAVVCQTSPARYCR